jgi:hypothetical protein
MLIFRVRDYAGKDDLPDIMDGLEVGTPVKLELSSEFYAHNFADADRPLADHHITDRWIYFYAELDTTGP